jgi:hypothetical protein
MSFSRCIHTGLASLCDQNGESHETDELEEQSEKGPIYRQRRTHTITVIIELVMHPVAGKKQFRQLQAKPDQAKHEVIFTGSDSRSPWRMAVEIKEEDKG